jgi:hypothetical protein
MQLTVGAIMIGKVFGKLTVLLEVGRSNDKQRTYLCQCECGTQTTVISGNLKKGNSRSCGCARRKTCADRMRWINLKHGQTETKLWRTWKGVLDRTTRVTNSNFKRYGGRNITVCDEWKNFEVFAKDVGQPTSDSHSLDRIDNSLGYFPGNVRWATSKEQAHNRSNNVWVWSDGQKMIASEAAKKIGVSKSTIARWIQSGRLQKVEQ